MSYRPRSGRPSPTHSDPVGRQVRHTGIGNDSITLRANLAFGLPPRNPATGRGPVEPGRRDGRGTVHRGAMRDLRPSELPEIIMTRATSAPSSTRPPGHPSRPVLSRPASWPGCDPYRPRRHGPAHRTLPAPDRLARLLRQVAAKAAALTRLPRRLDATALLGGGMVLGVTAGLGAGTIPVSQTGRRPAKPHSRR